MSAGGVLQLWFEVAVGEFSRRRLRLQLGCLQQFPRLGLSNLVLFQVFSCICVCVCVFSLVAPFPAFAFPLIFFCYRVVEKGQSIVLSLVFYFLFQQLRSFAIFGCGSVLLNVSLFGTSSLCLSFQFQWAEYICCANNEIIRCVLCCSLSSVERDWLSLLMCWCWWWWWWPPPHWILNS